jgi:hydrogenase nickel incorporation protein HypA/HybF
LCEGSKLHFRRIPAKLVCFDCAAQFAIEKELTPCPNCGSMRAKIIEGEEFFLESIEIER